MTIHYKTDVMNRGALALKAHSATAVWKLRVPGDIVKNAFVASSGHAVPWSNGVLEFWSIAKPIYNRLRIWR